MTDKPSYPDICFIPAEIFTDKRLPANAKLLYGNIASLCNKTGVCWASNKFFANMYGVSERVVSGWIKKLAEYDYIKHSVDFKEESKQVDRRYLELSEPWKKSSIGGRKNFQEGIEDNFQGGIEKNFQGNNTRKNNTSYINNGQRQKSKSEDKKTASYDIEQYTKSALENEIVYDRAKYKPP